MTLLLESELRDLLVQRGRELEKEQRQNKKLLEMVGSLNIKLAQVTAALAALQSSANQPTEPEPSGPTPENPAPNIEDPAQTSAAQAEREKRKKKKRKDAKKARKASRLSAATADLEQQEDIRIPERCPECDGTDLVMISEDSHKVVTLIPAKLMVRATRRWHCRCKGCSHIVVADAPEDLLPNISASPSLLAKIIHDKWQLRLTTYRIRQELDRLGLRVHEGTLDGWMAGPAAQLALLLPALKEEIFGKGVIHFDGTGHTVLKKGGNTLGQIAVFGNELGVIYDFSEDKHRKHLEKFLGYGTMEAFRGTIVTDADPRLDRYFAEKYAIECGCNAHALRYFEKAESNDAAKANEALSYWWQMYDFEQQAQEMGLTGAALLEWRQRHQAPLSRTLHQFLNSLRGLSLPSEPIHKAVMYALRQWGALTRYLTDPRLPMDNNFAERCLRQVVVGRKNYLFMGSVEAGKRGAIYYSFMETCRLRGVDPVAWMTDVLPRIRSTRASELRTLLPGAWKEADSSLALAA